MGHSAHHQRGQESLPARTPDDLLTTMHKSQRHANISCKWKAKYATAEEADKARAEKQAEYKLPLQIYLCRYCFGWHLTSK